MSIFNKLFKTDKEETIIRGKKMNNSDRLTFSFAQ